MAGIEGVIISNIYDKKGVELFQDQEDDEQGIPFGRTFNKNNDFIESQDKVDNLDNYK